MEKKKETREQLEKRIKKSLVFIPRDKDYKAIFFSDKGLKIEVTKDYCVISTGYHKHIFDVLTSGGLSRAYIYANRFVEIALEHLDKIIVKQENNTPYYSYTKLMDVLKSDKEKTIEYAIAFYCDMWFYNLFSPLYEIGETESSQFMTFLHYVENLSRNTLILSEKVDDMTNKQFLNSFIDKVKDITKDMNERVIFTKITDEDFANKEMDSMKELEINDNQTKS